MQWLAGLEGVNHHTSQATGSASSTAGSLVEIRTRALAGVERICGNEGVESPAYRACSPEEGRREKWPLQALSGILTAVAKMTIGQHTRTAVRPANVAMATSTEARKPLDSEAI